MKLYAIFLLALSACPLSAFAYGSTDCVQDVVQADKEIGDALVTKLCSDASSFTVECYTQSFSLDKGIGRELSIGLCIGARSLQPLTCYKDIFSLDKGMSRGLAVNLCNHAQSVEPLTCYKNIFSFDNAMSRGIAIDLCSESTNAQNTIKCYVNAVHKGMSPADATNLCGIPKAR